MSLNQINTQLLVKHCRLTMHEFNENKFKADYPRLFRAICLSIDQARVEELQRAIYHLQGVAFKDKIIEELEAVIKDIRTNMDNNIRR